jgi:hypothetical protein
MPRYFTGERSRGVSANPWIWSSTSVSGAAGDKGIRTPTAGKRLTVHYLGLVWSAVSGALANDQILLKMGSTTLGSLVPTLVWLQLPIYERPLIGATNEVFYVTLQGVPPGNLFVNYAYQEYD